MILTHFKFEEFINIQMELLSILQQMAVVLSWDHWDKSGSPFNGIICKTGWWCNVFWKEAANKNAVEVDIVKPQLDVPFSVEIFEPITGFLQKKWLFRGACHKLSIGIVGNKRINDGLSKHVEIEHWGRVNFDGRWVSCLIILVSKELPTHHSIREHN